MNEYIWVVSADGVPWRIPVFENPTYINHIDWESFPCFNNTIRTIVGGPKSAFCIDRSGKIYIFVYRSHIAIRKKVEVYFNQRWYPILKWQRPLPTDRSPFSDETGKITDNLSFYETELGWSWEEPWTTQLDPRYYDSEGWQYSSSFLTSKWEKSCKKFNFVRRKKLKRHMRYTSHENWIELSNSYENFVEIAVGGTDILNEGELLLFALGTDGNIYRREGIQINKPNGLSWIKLPPIIIQNTKIDDVTLISLSPTLGTLLCITWDGKMFYRKGISKEHPCGFTWNYVETPMNRNVIWASIGKNALWCLTADGVIWFTKVDVNKQVKEHMLDEVKSNQYQEVSTSGACKISVTKEDQVFCISNQNESVKIRLDISADEPSGKTFESIIDRGDPKNQKWIFIHAGSCSFSKIPDYLLNNSILEAKQSIMQFKNSVWRKIIMESIDRSNKEAWKVMSKVKGSENEINKTLEEIDKEEKIKTFKCQLETRNGFETVTINIEEQFIEIIQEKQKKTIDTENICGVYPVFQRLPQKYLLLITVKKNEEMIVLSLPDEISKDNMVYHLEKSIKNHIISKTRSSFSENMWAITREKNVRWYCLAEVDKTFEKLVPIGEAKSLSVEGNFDVIECGALRLVWALNSTGMLYSLDSKFDPLNQERNDFENQQTNEINYQMFEYQKYAIFRGFISFQGSQKEVSAWMCDNKPVPQHFSSLNSKNWSWIDKEWNLKNDDWEYSDRIDGKYEKSSIEQGKARRRIWNRRAKYESYKSPWCLVEGPYLKAIRVAKIESENGNVIVVGLTIDGHILVRNEVCRNNFSGLSWSQIVIDYPVVSIHLQKYNILWCVTTDAQIMSVLLNSNHKSTQNWNALSLDLTELQTVFNNNLMTDIDISGSLSVLYLRIKHLLFRIDTVNNTVSDPYSVDNLQQISANSKDFLLLRGKNITIVYEWKIATYEDERRTIIAIKKTDKALNIGSLLKYISVF